MALKKSEPTAYNQAVAVGVPVDSVEHQISVVVTGATAGHFLVDVKAAGCEDFEPLKSNGVPVQVDAVSPETVTGLRALLSQVKVTPVGLDAGTYVLVVGSYSYS